MNNLDIVKEYSSQLWELKDVTVIDKFFDKAAIIYSPIETTYGPEKMKSLILLWFRAFPNIKVYWDDFICEGCKVVSRWHAEGLHEGEFLGYPATNKQIRYQGVSIYSLANEKINKYWAFIDMQVVKNQISK